MLIDGTDVGHKEMAEEHLKAIKNDPSILQYAVYSRDSIS